MDRIITPIGRPHEQKCETSPFKESRQVSTENTLLKARYLGFPEKAATYLALAIKTRQNALIEAELITRNAKKAAKALFVRTRKKANEKAYKAATRKVDTELLKRHYEIDLLYEATVKQANQECFSLALAIAKEIIGNVVISEADVVTARIQSALEKLVDSRVHTILVHPDSLAAVKATLHERFPARKFNCLASDKIAPGNSAIETPAGTIELLWEDHFRVIEEKLKRKLNERVQETHAATSNT